MIDSTREGPRRAAASPAADSLELLRAARAQHRAGAGSVLDVLRRMSGPGLEALAEQCCAIAGAPVLQDTSELRADFRHWDRDRAKSSRAVVIADTSGRTWFAAEDPWDDALAMEVAVRTGTQPTPTAIDTASLHRWIGPSQTGASLSSDTKSEPTAAANPTAATDGPIVLFVDQALQAGFIAGASDIHFECDRSGVSVKHRLDGVLSRFARMDNATSAQEVISRIKVMAQLDITERRLPQDGRFRMEIGAGTIDLRVSIMPSVHGEDAVLRLLDKSQLRSRNEVVSLDALGFGTADASRIRALASAPSGMLLVTGPTGSGKTTTVYAALSEINTGLEKIITIEDPVEYELPGVLQIPVNERKGLTFAKGLRSILRHDPDRILVGEIRDAETAEIAVQSALTGHLVFTTVHANSMTDVVGRFRHFGLDMFGFMSSLNGLVVQRLVRRLCTHCRSSRAATEAEQSLVLGMGLPRFMSVGVATGCPACHGSGYHGRFVLAEVHLVEDDFRDKVTEGAPLSMLKDIARRKGVPTLLALSMEAVAAGDTTLEEIRRVVGWL